MEPAEWAKLSWRERIFHLQTLKILALGLAVGLPVAAAFRHFRIQPQLAANQKRYQATLDVARLYALQVSYKKAKGTYANDLDSLLALARDGAALKANLAANADLSTLAVDGDKDKFKIELNVLDADRTPIKFHGPLTDRPRAPSHVLMPSLAPPPNSNGKPLSSGR
jgi:Na+-transporting NADH:ubiquinone oxidoreductase subunit NqrC